MAIEALTLGTDSKTKRTIILLESTRERVLVEPCSALYLFHFPLGTSSAEVRRIIEEDGNGIGAEAYFANYLHPYSTTSTDGSESDNLTGAYIDHKKVGAKRSRGIPELRHRSFVSPVMFFTILQKMPAS